MDITATRGRRFSHAEPENKKSQTRRSIASTPKHDEIKKQERNMVLCISFRGSTHDGKAGLSGGGAGFCYIGSGRSAAVCRLEAVAG